MTTTPVIGNIYYFHNPKLLRNKKNSTGKERHPHILIKMMGEICVFIPVSTTADTYGFKSTQHWLPTELSNGGFSHPSFVALNHGTKTLSVERLPAPAGYIDGLLLEMVCELYEVYKLAIEVSPAQFLLRNGCGNTYSDVQRTKSITTSDALVSAGLPVVTLQDTKINSIWANAAIRRKR